VAAQLKIRLCANADGSITIRVAREADPLSAPVLRQALKDATTGSSPPTIDITDLSHLDPTGLTVLFEAARETGLEMIIGPGCRAYQVVEVSGLRDVAYVRSAR